VIARGAWLHHTGRGLLRDAHARGAVAAAAMNAEMTSALENSWAVFREKWGTQRLPQRFADFGDKELTMLGQSDMTGAATEDYQPPISVNPDVCELL